MYDTVACFTSPARIIPDDKFQGGMVQEDFGNALVMARLWRNPGKGEDYTPRVTYWRPMGKKQMDDLGQVKRVLGAVDELPMLDEMGMLKIEFSIPKMLNRVDVLLRNLQSSEVDEAIRLVDQFVRALFDLPSILHWRVGRVDYAWNWSVGSLLPAYMGVLNKLHFSTYNRHPFSATEGVVWKSKSTKGRWVKFYNKTLELGVKGLPKEKARELGVENLPAVLRFEVSNYKDSVKRMCADWFGCEQVVGEVLLPGRALYVMAFVWEKLGLGKSDSYGYDEYELLRLRDAFGDRVPTAHYVLTMLRLYGAECYKQPLNLMSKSMYYSYRRELRKNKFLATVQSKDRMAVVREALPALHLPTVEVYSELNVTPQDLGYSDLPAAINNKENFWQILSERLGLTQTAEAQLARAKARGVELKALAKTECSDYLMERVYVTA